MDAQVSDKAGGETALRRPRLAVVPISALGVDPKNVRKTNPEPGAALLASIKMRGVIVPLLVREIGLGKFGVIDGQKRLAAARAAGITNLPVAIVEAGDREAEDDSLTVAVIRDRLHPVDEYEAFAQLVADGKTPEEIGRDYAMTPLDVRKVLLLGGLSPTIRGAWREGKIDAASAQRFTLALDHAHQDSVFKRLSKQRGHVSDWDVRQAFAVKDNDAPRLLRFVGIDAYKAAGGRVIEDLFPRRPGELGEDVPSDLKLLHKMADERLAIERDRLLAAGWSWVETERTNDLYMMARLPTREPKLDKDDTKALAAAKKEFAKLDRLRDDDDAELTDEQWNRLEAIEAEIQRFEDKGRDAAYTEAEKAKAGCYVGIDHNGELEVSIGHLKGKRRGAPGTEGARAKPKKNPRADGSAAISDALTRRLGEQLTLAAQRALPATPTLAIALLAAGFRTHGSEIGVRLTPPGFVSAKPEKSDAIFAIVTGEKTEKAVAAYDGLDVAEINKDLVVIAAAALNLSSWSPVIGPSQRPEAKAILDRMDGPRLNEELLRVFDREDYFGSASATVVKKALDEMGVSYLGTDKKPALVALAITHATKATGWLPPELRTVHYAGPKPAVKPAAKPAGGFQEPKDGRGDSGGRKTPTKATKPAGARRSKPKGSGK